MATECRKRKIDKHKIATIEICLVVAMFIAIGFMPGLLIGKHMTKGKVVTETVEVPVYRDKLPDLKDNIDYYDVPLSHSLQKYIYEVCADEKVPTSLIMAMIEKESGFNPEAKSSTGDCGLIQINKINFSKLEEEYRAADMLNPYQNVFCGIKIIGSYLKKYDGNYTKALMAYNLGEYGAKKAWESGIKSTSYTESVLKLMSEYDKEISK